MTSPHSKKSSSYWAMLYVLCLKVNPCLDNTYMYFPKLLTWVFWLQNFLAGWKGLSWSHFFLISLPQMYSLHLLPGLDVPFHHSMHHCSHFYRLILDTLDCLYNRWRDLNCIRYSSRQQIAYITDIFALGYQYHIFFL